MLDQLVRALDDRILSDSTLDKSQFEKLIARQRELGLVYGDRPTCPFLRPHIISRTQYEAIMQALRNRKGPLQNTPLGGLIYIHGNGAQSDWTWGCVALENEDIRELFNAVSIGTPVSIEP